MSRIGTMPAIALALALTAGGIVSATELDEGPNDSRGTYELMKWWR